LWFLGWPDQALALCAEALHRAQLLQDAFSEAMARSIALRIHQLRGEHEVVADQSQAAIAFCKEHGFVHYLATSLILRGWATASHGNIDQGIAEINEGLEIGRTKGALIIETYALALLADACIRGERHEQALGFLRRALQILEQDGSPCFFAAEIYRLMAEASFRLSGNLPEAEQWISRGLNLARAQNAKSLELKLCLSVCDLYSGGDARHDAQLALRDVFESFKEGYDTSDLSRAGAVLGGHPSDVGRARKREQSPVKHKSRKDVLKPGQSGARRRSVGQPSSVPAKPQPA
jgi:tetratricopeptide (TPR) repeat protein